MNETYQLQIISPTMDTKYVIKSLFPTKDNLDNEAGTVLPGTHKIMYSTIRYMAGGQ